LLPPQTPLLHQVGAAMTNQLTNDSNKPVLESEKPCKAYEPPKLMPLESVDIASGSTNVPENNSGLLEAS
jgi:hypothetical protein